MAAGPLITGFQTVPRSSRPYAMSGFSGWFGGWRRVARVPGEVSITAKIGFPRSLAFGDLGNHEPLASDERAVGPTAGGADHYLPPAHNRVDRWSGHLLTTDH